MLLPLSEQLGLCLILLLQQEVEVMVLKRITKLAELLPCPDSCTNAVTDEGESILSVHPPQNVSDH